MIDKDADDNQRAIDFGGERSPGASAGGVTPPANIPTLDRIVHRDTERAADATSDVEAALADLEALTANLHQDVLAQMRALIERALDHTLARLRESLLQELDRQLRQEVPVAVDKAIHRSDRA